ncbi:MAG: serine/threonine protein kinase [Nannocystales bacterium]
MTKPGSQSAEPIPLRPEARAGAPQAGEVIADRYTVLRRIGRGGMGDVYLASTDDDRPNVALKMLSDRWVDQPDAVARFEREATRLSSVEHPNVVRLHGSGVDRGRPYLVMEYVDGESLSDYLERKGALTLREFVPIAAQILKGMGHAHLREMMIRDVKPSNIMLCCRKGRANFVKLLDFGLAKFTSKEPQLTQGHVLGTAGYLAPEAIRGEELDLRVDVYAIGVVFYKMLSGVLPFADSESTTLLYKTLDEVPTALEKVIPQGREIPEALLSLVSDCLEKDRSRRPLDANIIVERLIDSVPASLFRLPTAELSSRSPGYGNSGLMELVRVNPSSRFPSGALTEEAPTRENAPPPRTMRRLAIIGLAVLVPLVTASAIAFLEKPSTAAEETAASVSPSSVVPLAQEHPTKDSVVGSEAPQLSSRTIPAAEPPARTPAPSAQVPDEEDAPTPVATAERSPQRSKSRSSRRRRRAQTPDATPPPASPEPVATPAPEVPKAEAPKPAPLPAAAPPPEPPARKAGRDSVFLSADRDESRKSRKSRPGLLPAR